MTVVIVGAGIGGLTAALALRARNIDTIVLEQATELGEVGTGLQIGPNASRVLYRLGLEEDLAPISLTVEESVRRRWKTGEILTKTTLGSAATTKFGSPYLHLHRADLHSVLHDAATDPQRPGPPALVRTTARVASIDQTDPERPVAVTTDGTRWQANVIIGADGIRSAVRSAIGGPGDIETSGDMAYRTLVPAETLRVDPATRWIFDWPAAQFWLGENRHVVAYPVRNMEYVNVVAIAPVTPQVDLEWRCEVDATQMRQEYAGWDERLTRLLAASPDRVTAWALNYQKPFADWNHDSIALLGDACHSMLPYFSQGASQAIEDGAVIAEELAAADDGETTIPQALARYSSRRADHAGIVQNGATNNRDLFHLPDGPAQQHRDAQFRSHHEESNVSFDWIYHGTPLADDHRLLPR